MKYRIASIPGDGIGPEIVREARKVLAKVGEVYGHTFEYEDLLMGGCSIDVYGESLTDETLEKAKGCDSVLLGAVGGNVGQSNWYQIEPSKRPEAGLLKIRKGLELYANIRPAILFDELSGACPLKEELTEGGFDFVVMRELTGGLYFGERQTIEENGVKKAIDTLSYNENEIRRIAIKAFEIARKRRNKVTSVDKANVLDSSRLWRKVVEEVAKDYPEIEADDKIIDNTCMQLVMNPNQFDVMVMQNLYGDILSDLCSGLIGGLGLVPSSNIGADYAMFEAVHGSAPDIAGKHLANPTAFLWSACMMLEYLGENETAARIRKAVDEVLAEGKHLTKDLHGTASTEEYVDAILERL